MNHWRCLPLIFIVASRALAAAPIDYLRDVKPLLSAHCSQCHGASQQKAGLRLDTARVAHKGGSTGPGFVAGQGAASLIVRAVKGEAEDLPRMPYKKPALSSAQIALLETWINEGAQAPADEVPQQNIHWAFMPPRRPTPPPTQRTDWSRNPIDQFILLQQEKHGIAPAPEADKITLMRRLSLDLTGLPPTPADINHVQRDTKPGALEKYVERLLGSPHYGERWGRHWLDLARYADSNGYSIDAPRSIWKYRDWVIAAINNDQPFDQFVVEQLAGDLLPQPSLDQKIATGFNRNTQLNQEGGIDPEQFRVESVMDRVNTTATAFLGITLACAQCHDHKFDPFTQREYYQFYAFFNNTVDDGHGKGAPEGMLEIPGELQGTDNAHKELEEAEADLDRYLDTKGNEVTQWEQKLSAADRSKLKPEVVKVLKVPFAERTRKQKRTVYAAFRPEDAEFKPRQTKLTRLERRQPKPVTTLVMMELPQPRESVVFTKGDFTRRADPVHPGTPAILAPDLSSDGLTGANGTPNRLDLARWMVDPRNPLVARVAVNRLWQHYFGRGLVETENDFGTQGSPPTHPELLDWLATELIAQGWSLKAMHRLIVNSATYRQSSHLRPELKNVDPGNRLLARQSRLRLEAEIVRDVALSASGQLQPRIGGPGVFPPQPAGVMTLGQSKREWTASTGADRYRRGIYTFFWRATPHPALMVFDSPDGFSSCTRRVRSNTPLQALTLLNDESYHELAEAFAARLLAQDATDNADRIASAFQLCLARSPRPAETARLLQLLQQEFAPTSGNTSEAGVDVGAQKTRLAAWTTIARVLLNLDETITRE